MGCSVSDFFDTNSTEPSAKDDEEAMDCKPADNLPEGFFDDPKADAKVFHLSPSILKDSCLSVQLIDCAYIGKQRLSFCATL